MMRILCALLVFVNAAAFGGGDFPHDIIKTSAGPVEITFIGHGSLMMRFSGRIIQIDPYSHLTDYAKLPKADLVLITHDHPDHFDPEALRKIVTKKTEVILTSTCAKEYSRGITMKNGDVKKVLEITVEAVPAYNLVAKRPDGAPFHPKGEGNGYILTFGKTRIYIAGDTEDTPEMKALKNIDVAFLPMNLPYTMTPEMVAEGAKAFRPRILYPYHTGETDVNRLVALLKDEKGIEVRVRPMK